MIEDSQHPYHGIEIVMATMHGKEEIASPYFKDAFNATITPTKFLNTDLLGTFTGEIKRVGSVESTLRRKVRLAINETNHRFALASEGSFGPHPSFPFVYANQESLLFFDSDTGVEFFEHYLCTRTSYAYKEINNIEDISDFLNSMSIASQAVILRPKEISGIGADKVFKGLCHHDQVYSAYRQLSEVTSIGPIVIETDNRAHVNEFRRSVIAKTFELLIASLLSQCPQCHCPGYKVRDRKGHLPCLSCGFLSNIPKYEVWTCLNPSCLHRDQKTRADDLMEVAPQYCNFCNP